MWWLILFIQCLVQRCSSQFVYVDKEDKYFEIAGIFEQDGGVQMRAFNESMRYGHLEAIQLQPILIRPSRTDSFSVWRELCTMKEMRPIAVIGPQNPITDGAIRDQCAIANIPHIQATWQPYDPYMEIYNEVTETENENTEDDDNEEQNDEPSQSFRKMTINFYPDSDEIAVAYAKVLAFYGWENFAALYEDNFGLLRIQKILAEHTDKFPVTLHRLDPNGDNRNIFKRLDLSRESRILLDCHVDHVFKYMDEASYIKKIKDYQHYLLVNTDSSIISEQLKKLPSNFTWLSITEYDKLEDAKHPLAPRVGRWKNEILNSSVVVTDIKNEALLMDDIANHVLQAIENIKNFDTPNTGICEKDVKPWEFGAAVQQQILETQSTGVTGNVQFDENGKRFNYTLYVNEIHVMRRLTVGTWNSVDNSEIYSTGLSNDTAFGNIKTKEFKIISRQSEPYFMEKKPCTEKCEEDPDSDEKYEGFVVDLVKNIFIKLNEENNSYTYRFIDRKKPPGTYDAENKKWTGLIGDLLDNEADLAVCDLTITEERKKVVDFSVPFMTLGISILALNEDSVPPGYFSFLNPYSVDVWMLTATAYCIVSVVLFVCARISPADWENPEPCEKDPEELENIWTFKNCTWLTMGSIMTQGCDILPKYISIINFS